MMIPRIQTLLLALSLVTVRTAAAADDPTTLREGERVRIETAADPGLWLAGTFVGIEEGRFILLPREETAGTVRYPVADLTRVQVHAGRRGHTGTGLLVGALTGLVITAVAHAGENDSNGFGPDASNVLLITLGAPTFLGALLGTAIRTGQWEDADTVSLTLGPSPRFGGLALTLSW